jgi:hypothetical protein
VKDQPPPLGELQQWMLGSILHPETAAPAKVATHIAPSPTLAPRQRLAIYQRGYLARLRECMAGQFRALHHALGDELFGDFVEEYLRAHPSRSPTLSELGARFAQFLHETRPDRAQPEPWVDFMIELARYEWDIFQKFDAPGHEGRPLAELTTRDADLRLQSSLSLHRYDFPVDAYYHEVSIDGDPDVPELHAICMAILRKDYRVGMFRLAPPQYDCLRKMSGGQDLPTALSETASEQNVTAEAATAAWQRWRPAWIEQGFFGVAAAE